MFGNISKILEMKKKAEEMKGKLGEISIVKENLGVKVTLSGMNKIEKIELSDDFLTNKSKEQVAEALTLVIQAAQEELNNHLRSELSSLTGGMGL
jgi:DNA-binding protein YbaB